MRRIRRHLTYANVVATLALLIAIAGGTAYAANTVFSTDIVDGQVRTVDLANGAVSVAKLADGSITGDKLKDASVQGRDVLDNSLKGADIDESTLTNIGGGGPAGGDLTGKYPNPQIAPDAVGGAEVDESTLQNVDAARIGGLEVRKINFQVPFGTGPTTVLDLGGLQITAECQNFGDLLDVKAFTSKDGAGVHWFSGHTVGADDTDAVNDLGSNNEESGFFGVGDQFQIDNATPNSGDEVMGTLHYMAPDGSVVVVDLVLETTGPPFGCALTGIAIGG